MTRKSGRGLRAAKKSFFGAAFEKIKQADSEKICSIGQQARSERPTYARLISSETGKNNGKPFELSLLFYFEYQCLLARGGYETFSKAKAKSMRMGTDDVSCHKTGNVLYYTQQVNKFFGAG